jgi:tRNA threonylcarbamoyladenosine biosynthesis protein TsaE
VNTRPEIRCATASANATQDLACAIAPLIVDGDLLVLVGDLGAGKTAFTQGMARALGVDEPVTSPTFTLANRYQGRVVVNHLDVYRIEALAEARDLALVELLDEGLTLIEWGDVILPALPDDRLDVRITFGEGDDDRLIALAPVGERWMQRRGPLAAAVSEWRT